MRTQAKIENLGQTGLMIHADSLTVLVDPYLSNSVQELIDPALERQVPILYQPESLTYIDWVLITHDHMDHCDPHTIPTIAVSSPSAKFLGPLPVCLKLKEWGISSDRIFRTNQNAFNLGSNLSVKAIPSAHPDISMDHDGNPQTVGYFLENKSRNLYVAGDTSLCDDLISVLRNLGSIDSALLPVNEDNYFRRQRGIIGNMSIREAFGLAKELKIRHVVPVHWDLFVVNSTLPDEIKAVYDGYDWGFSLDTIDQILF